MKIEVNTQLEIPFNDVDAMAVVWHGNYLKYFEVSRGQLLRKIDYDYPDMQASGYSWPVIECKCRFIASATYGMKVNIHSTITEWENRLFISYLITEEESNKRLCKGHTIQVAVNQKNGEMQFASPQILLDKINGVLS
jgi:acyl-CoA thioester hydrolase